MWHTQQVKLRLTKGLQSHISHDIAHAAYNDPIPSQKDADVLGGRHNAYLADGGAKAGCPALSVLLLLLSVLGAGTRLAAAPVSLLQASVLGFCTSLAAASSGALLAEEGLASALLAAWDSASARKGCCSSCSQQGLLIGCLSRSACIMTEAAE